MDRLSLLWRRRAIHRRADQRVTKGHARADREQPVGVGRRFDPDPEPRRRPPHQHRVSDRLRRRHQQQPLSIRRQPREPATEAVLDPPRQPRGVQRTEPARELRRRQPPRQLQQRQRISARLGDETFAHPLIQRHPHRRAQQSTRITIAQTLDHQCRQPHQLFARVTRHQHQRDRLRQQPPRHEHERLRRRAIQPLRVVNHTHKRPLRGHLRQQAQHRQPDQKPIRCVPSPQPERHAQRVPLRDGKPIEPIQQRCTQLLQRRERKLHLRLHTRSPHRPEPWRGPDRALHQRRLANPRLAAYHQHPALSTPHRLKQPAQHPALSAPAVQHLRRPLGDHAPPTIPRPCRSGHPRLRALQARTTRCVIRSPPVGANVDAPHPKEPP